MKVQFVPRHFVPGVKFTPSLKSVSEYIESTIGLFQHEKNDCVIKAISAVERVPYIDVRRMFGSHKSRGGVRSNVIHNYLKGRGLKGGEYFPVGTEAKTVAGFAKLHPRGRYVLMVRGHMVSVIDGVVMDDWNSSNKRLQGGRFGKWHGAWQYIGA